MQMLLYTLAVGQSSKISVIPQEECYQMHVNMHVPEKLTVCLLLGLYTVIHCP